MCKIDPVSAVRRGAGCPRTMLNLWENFILSRYSSKIRFYIYTQYAKSESKKKIWGHVAKFGGNSFLRISLDDPCFLFHIQIEHSLKINWTKFHTNGVRKVDLYRRFRDERL